MKASLGRELLRMSRAGPARKDPQVQSDPSPIPRNPKL